MELRNERGLTIIELMVSMVIVGGLAGIMASAYKEYQKRSYNATAVSDLRNALVSLETYIDDNAAFPTCTDDACNTMDGFARTPGVKIFFVQTAGVDGVSTACFPNSGDKRYIKASATGIIVELPGATC